MKKLLIESRSRVLPDSVILELNERNDYLVKVVVYELSDTGFFAETKFAQLKLTQLLTETLESTLSFQEDSVRQILEVTSSIPVSDFRAANGDWRYAYAEEAAVTALANVVEKYELDSSALVVRAKLIRTSLRAQSHVRFPLLDLQESTEPFVSDLPTIIPVRRYDIPSSGSAFMGKFKAGNQFWAQVVAEFQPVGSETSADTWGTRKCWFAVLHKFDAQGNHLETDCKLVGRTADGEAAVLREAEKEMHSYLNKLEQIEFGDIAIRLFKVEIEGFVFGMIDTSTAECSSVTMVPGDLWFSEPWDGEFDT